MNFTEWVDVAIGLVIVYLGASLFLTILNEFISQLRNLRGAKLAASLAALIDDDSVKAQLRRVPALKPFFEDNGKGAGSYVDPQVVAQFLMGSLAKTAAPGDTVRRFADAVSQMTDSALKAQLQAITAAAGDKADRLLAMTSDWIERSLTMLGDEYKRVLQKQSLVVGILLAAALNLDTLALTRTLYEKKETRDTAAAMGVMVSEKVGKEVFEKCLLLSPEALKADPACAQLLEPMRVILNRSESLSGLPIGWRGSGEGLSGPDRTTTVWIWMCRLAGWALTGLAVSLGAPFWFDLLNKLVNVRHGMPKPAVKKSLPSSSSAAP